MPARRRCGAGSRAHTPQPALFNGIVATFAAFFAAFAFVLYPNHAALHAHPAAEQLAKVSACQLPLALPPSSRPSSTYNLKAPPPRPLRRTPPHGSLLPTVAAPACLPTCLPACLPAAQLLPPGLEGLVGMVKNWTFTAFYAMSELWGDVVLGLGFWCG